MVQSPALEHPSVKLGDRVRVVLEGEVGDVYQHGFRIKGAVNVFRPDENPAVQSVEVLSRKPKVGDEIRGEQAYVDLPAHSVIRCEPGVLVKQPNGKWFDSTTGQHFETLTLGRELVHIP